MEDKAKTKKKQFNKINMIFYTFTSFKSLAYKLFELQYNINYTINPSK